MDHAKKMLMITPEALHRLQNPQPSMVNDSLSEMDQDMQRILRLHNLTDKEKWEMYNKTLNRFLHFVNEGRRAIQFPIIEDNDKNIETNDQKPESEIDSVKQQTLASIPKQLKPKAEQLYDTLSRSGVINWNDLGLVKIHGQTIQGSSIVDLLNDTVRNRQTAQDPIGWDVFSNVLAELNIPFEYVGNLKRREYIRQKAKYPDTPLSPTSLTPSRKVKGAVLSPKAKKENKRRNKDKNSDWLPYRL